MDVTTAAPSLDEGSGVAMSPTLGVRVLRTVDGLSGERCWRPLQNELMGFIQVNVMWYSSVKITENPQLLAAMRFRVDS